ncbi:hypothetical protein HNR23_003875 [Nocardiopsis mwathae]|uniref:Uncharacterized protein n=1 Tax=Nocardiopsis mwathae TaxID=1472723 RepID=A0A7W9YKE9_9ACTN|nr:hypothetical protein [Nocardiopsis mwathae]MBB6173815.1 hypothetical protein [Nocardiopsis mwathae]
MTTDHGAVEEWLRATYGGQYRIYRSRYHWSADPTDPGLAPIVEDLDDVDAFVRQLENPARRPPPSDRIYAGPQT